MQLADHAALIQLFEPHPSACVADIAVASAWLTSESRLAELAAHALSAGRNAAALAISDRLCRVAPLIQPTQLVLRAESRHRTGDAAGALQDIRRALEIDPDTIHALRRQMTWAAEAAERTEAARNLIEVDSARDVLRHATELLRRTQPQRPVWCVRRSGTTIIGWAAWAGTGPAHICAVWAHGRTELELAADPAHFAGGERTSASDFTLHLPEARSVTLRFRCASNAPMQRTFRPPPGQRVFDRHRAPQRPDTSGPISIIVPVFRDLNASRYCLDGVLAQLKSNERLIAVNDASPEEGMSAYLNQLPCTVLTNSENLGFVASINRALAECSTGDVILLNADTLVPPGFAGRMQSVAYSASDIGSVTPLSNNGELMSYPVANAVNVLPSSAEVEAINDAAWRAHGDAAFDVPNGTGFCMYLTRALLDATGGRLPDSYERGYYEDVDICLSGRRSGLRSVCATGVFVGHAGTKSFLSEKRRLVVRNLAVLEQSFPGYRLECAAFVKGDGLRPARARLEAADPRFQEPVCLVVGSAAIAGSLEQRVSDLRKRGLPAAALVIDGSRIEVRRPTADGFTGNIVFDQGLEQSAARRYLASLAIDRVEVADSAPFAGDLIGAISERRPPMDVLALTGAIFETARLNPTLFARVVATSADAVRFARDNAIADCPIVFDEPDDGTDPARESAVASQRRLAIVSLDGGMRSNAIAAQIAAMSCRDQGAKPVLFGGVPDSVSLIAGGQMLVSGPVPDTELVDAIGSYGCTHVWLISGRVLFDCPRQRRLAASGYPVAKSNWCAHRPPDEIHLLLDPGLDDAAQIEAVLAWCSGIAEPRAASASW